MAFRDPMPSLNPRHRVGRIITAAPLFYGQISACDADYPATELLVKAGLNADFPSRYPDQFSRGQRIAIARALAVKPEIIMADGSVSALDVSVQAQMLNLFADLRRELGLAYLSISHDLGVVKHIYDQVFAMYLGRKLEEMRIEDPVCRTTAPLCARTTGRSAPPDMDFLAAPRCNLS